uniref:Uncharacterized protein n=1 Tax=Glossina pallidipes TaxID=7398 RepID=A0A1A9ZIG7_GLOPL
MATENPLSLEQRGKHYESLNAIRESSIEIQTSANSGRVVFQRHHLFKKWQMRESRDIYWLSVWLEKSKVFNDTEKVELKIMENEKWLQEITFVCLLNGSKNMMSAGTTLTIKTSQWSETVNGILNILECLRWHITVEITTRAGVGLLECVCVHLLVEVVSSALVSVVLFILITNHKSLT